MRKMVIAAIGIPIAAALGLGCYELSKQNSSTTALQNQSSFPTPGMPLSPATPVNGAANTGSLQGNLPGQAPAMPPMQSAVPTGVLRSGAPTQALPGSQMDTTRAGTTYSNSSSTLTPPAQPMLYPEQPLSAAPPVVTQQTIEKDTVTSVPPRTVYVTKKVYISKHHKSGKVHIARATKHGVMFALKLPGRMAL